MQKSKKLIFAWLTYVLILSMLIIVTKIYHDTKKESISIYQYRILINKDLYKTESVVKKQESPRTTDISDSKSEIKEKKYEELLYERLKYGDVPKISPDGVRVLDIYSASFSIKNKKKICLAIFIDKILQDHIMTIIKILADTKVTFIVPHYLENLNDIVSIIVNSGHEFFLQIPTQTAIPSDKKKTVSPFLANTDKENVIDNLLNLLASTKYAIGIANTTSTLLTKSLKDMSVISEELSKRGLAFLDFEKVSDMSKKLSEDSSFIQANVSENFLSIKDINISEIYDGKVFAIHIEKLNDFLNAVAKHPEYVIAPVSCLFKNNND